MKASRVVVAGCVSIFLAFFAVQVFASQVAMQKTGAAGLKPQPQVKTRALFEKIRKIDDCSVAIVVYKEADKAVEEKAAICNGAERMDRLSDEKNTLAWELFSIAFDDRLRGECANVIREYEEAARSASAEARQRRSELSRECREGDSLSSLKSARSAAEDMVCSKCGGWPSALEEDRGELGELYVPIIRCQ